MGSAPNVYTLSGAGRHFLRSLGGGEALGRIRRQVASQFVAHELAITDCLVWLLSSARSEPTLDLQRFERGAAAVIDLGGQEPPHQVRPDAWFVMGVGERVLVGLVEIDRGTEKLAGPRWRDKLTAYGALFEGGALKRTTGYTHARVLVVAPDLERVRKLAALIHEHAQPSLAERFWLTTEATLLDPDLSALLWHRPGWTASAALISAAGCANSSPGGVSDQARGPPSRNADRMERTSLRQSLV
jgi:hypothetical protein